MRRTLLLFLLVTTVLIGEIFPSACHQGFSHQPSTINQMKMLVTPQDPTVNQALQEALAASDESISYPSSQSIADLNKIRLWIFTNIKQASDDDLHGVNDYWQTPSETLALNAGDCEDFAILTVSMLRANGVPKEQAYVAVGDDANNNWHAFVVERYSCGAWLEFDPQILADAVQLGSNTSLTYDISYCFNDLNGFNGIPIYPPGYTIPAASIVPVVHKPGPLLITDVNSHNWRLDEAKHFLGELWLPTRWPQDYVFATGLFESFPDMHLLWLSYEAGPGRELSLSETNAPGVVDISQFDPGTYEQTTINGQPAYFGIYTYSSTSRIGTSTPTTTTTSILAFGFVQGGLQIHFSLKPVDSLTHDELIKIAESFIAY